jgi:nucleoid DNA-binding protein
VEEDFVSIGGGRKAGQDRRGPPGGPSGAVFGRDFRKPLKNREYAVDFPARPFYPPTYYMTPTFLPPGFFERNAMANNAASKTASKGKALTKSAVYQHLADKTGLSRKQVGSVFDELSALIKNELGKKGPGVLAVGGLMKFKIVKKPATKAGRRPNPFKPGEMMEVKAKPARNSVKILALKSLKDMVK